MRYPEAFTLQQKEDLSRGFDHGNYGNAYECDDWETWCESQGDGEGDEDELACDAWSPEFHAGALLGFFGSYELHEISDEEVREHVAALRALYGEES